MTCNTTFYGELARLEKERDRVKATGLREAAEHLRYEAEQCRSAMEWADRHWYDIYDHEAEKLDDIATEFEDWAKKLESTKS